MKRSYNLTGGLQVSIKLGGTGKSSFNKYFREAVDLFSRLSDAMLDRREKEDLQVAVRLWLVCRTRW